MNIKPETRPTVSKRRRRIREEGGLGGRSRGVGGCGDILISSSRVQSPESPNASPPLAISHTSASLSFYAASPPLPCLTTSIQAAGVFPLSSSTVNAVRTIPRNTDRAVP